MSAFKKNIDRICITVLFIASFNFVSTGSDSAQLANITKANADVQSETSFTSYESGEWHVPTTGLYSLTAIGNAQSATRAAGGRVSGNVYLSAGDTLYYTIDYNAQGSADFRFGGNTASHRIMIAGGGGGMASCRFETLDGAFNGGNGALSGAQGSCDESTETTPNNNSAFGATVGAAGIGIHNEDTALTSYSGTGALGGDPMLIGDPATYFAYSGGSGFAGGGGAVGGDVKTAQAGGAGSSWISCGGTGGDTTDPAIVGDAGPGVLGSTALLFSACGFEGGGTAIQPGRTYGNQVTVSLVSEGAQDQTPPGISEYYPTNASQNIMRNGTATIVFDEDINVGAISGNEFVKLNEQELDCTSISSSRTLFCKYIGLEYSSTYAFSVSGYHDMSSNLMGLIEGESSFTTIANTAITASIDGTYYVPYTGIYQLTANANVAGGGRAAGGVVSGKTSLTAGQTLYYTVNYNGQGATDFRAGGTGTANRVMIAGGGGMGANCVNIDQIVEFIPGGLGGGLAGAPGQTANCSQAGEDERAAGAGTAGSQLSSGLGGAGANQKSVMFYGVPGDGAMGGAGTGNVNSESVNISGGSGFFGGGGGIGGLGCYADFWGNGCSLVGTAGGGSSWVAGGGAQGFSTDVSLVGNGGPGTQGSTAQVFSDITFGQGTSQSAGIQITGVQLGVEPIFESGGFDFEEETLLGFDMSLSYEVSASGNSITNFIGQSSLPISPSSSEQSITITTKARAAGFIDAAGIVVTIPRRQSMITLTVINPSAVDGNGTVQYGSQYNGLLQQSANGKIFAFGNSPVTLGQGAYDVRLAATTDSFASTYSHFTVQYIDPESIIQEAVFSGSINFIHEALEGFTPGLNYEIHLPDASVIPLNGSQTYALKPNHHPVNISIVTKANGPNHIDSAPFPIEIPPRPDLPDYEIDGGADTLHHTISPVTSAMQYRAVSASSWTQIESDGSLEVANGFYYLSIPAVAGNNFVSYRSPELVAYDDLQIHAFSQSVFAVGDAMQVVLAGGGLDNPRASIEISGFRYGLPLVSADSATLSMGSVAVSPATVMFDMQNIAKSVGTYTLWYRNHLGASISSHTVTVQHKVSMPANYSDVDSLTDDRFAAVSWLSTLNITEGCDDAASKYCPWNPVNRGSMAQFFHRLSGIAASSTSTGRFTDLAGLSATRIASINWMAASGITAGCNANGTKFCPGSTVNRGSMALFLQRFAEVKNVPVASTASFSDLAGVDSARRGAIEWLGQSGVTRGCNSDGSRFCPGNAVNRGSMAELMHRLAAILSIAS